MQKQKSKLTYENFHRLCLWITANAEELTDVKYPERATLAAAALEFNVTEANAKQASELVGCQHSVGRVNLVYFAMVALVHSGGQNLGNLAKMGRRIVREAAKKKADDGTPDMFPDAPELPELPDAPDAEAGADEWPVGDDLPQAEYEAPAEDEPSPDEVSFGVAADYENHPYPDSGNGEEDPAP